jgi:hypothetical protein
MARIPLRGGAPVDSLSGRETPSSRRPLVGRNGALSAEDLDLLEPHPAASSTRWIRPLIFDPSDERRGESKRGSGLPAKFG